MIRLHMRNHQIIQFAPVQRLVKPAKPFILLARVHRIQQTELFILNQIAVVAHAAGHGILPFKQIDLVIHHAQAENARRHFIHKHRINHPFYFHSGLFDDISIYAING